eukprot:GGOE01046377.1.p1 GENE.GGOE01046377.1~~GGOE01046377.1.p1  ORF type:complete len:448 (+),score=100.18 GGOE01046377.1:62-1345(+)
MAYRVYGSPVSPLQPVILQAAQQTSVDGDRFPSRPPSLVPSGPHMLPHNLEHRLAIAPQVSSPSSAAGWEDGNDSHLTTSPGQYRQPPVLTAVPAEPSMAPSAIAGSYPMYGPKEQQQVRVHANSPPRVYAGGPGGLAGFPPLRDASRDPYPYPYPSYADSYAAGNGGYLPPGWSGKEPPPPEEGLTVRNFLLLNPRLTQLKKERDKMLGWRRYLEAVIFAVTLFLPILGMVTRLKTYSWVLALLWAMIAAIMVFWIEYRCRAELWYICICRGIILDFKKTHGLKDWVLHPVMFIGYFFIVMCGVIVGLASTTLSDWERIVSGVLFAVGLVFVIKLIKAFIDLEGAPNTLTVNMLFFYFKNPRLMHAKGFKLVHYTQFAQYYLAQGLNGFRWDDVFQLSERPTGVTLSLVWGFRANWWLRRVKDMEE